MDDLKEKEIKEIYEIVEITQAKEGVALIHFGVEKWKTINSLIAIALQSYMRKRIDLLELANKNANAALADKCDEFGRYVEGAERKVLEGREIKSKNLIHIIRKHYFYTDNRGVSRQTPLDKYAKDVAMDILKQEGLL